MDLLEVTEKNMLRVFEGVGRNELAMVQAVFTETIRRCGGSISYERLRRETFTLCNEQEFAEVVKFLTDTRQWQTAFKGEVSFFVTAEQAAQIKNSKGKLPQGGIDDTPVASVPPTG